MKRRSFLYQTGISAAATALLPWSCRSSTDTETIILGGGFSGLYLAYLLEKEGRDYILLEGSNRLGGRMFSHPKLKREVGGRGIGDKYVETMKLVEELGVELIDITESMGSPSAIYYQGKLHDALWPEEIVIPSRMEFSRLRQAPALEKLNGWYQRPDLDIPYNEFLTQIGHSPEEIELININANYNDVYQTSAINSLHSRAFRQFNGTRRIFNFKNGSKDLIEAIANTLTRPIHKNKLVTSIIDSGEQVQVKCADDSSYTAKKVVTTLPFSTLRQVNIDGHLTAAHKQLIKELEYTKITQIHLQATDKFWEEDGLPASTWTDTPLERLMTMSAEANTDQFACWVNGKGTAFFDNMSDREIADYTLNKLKEIRPSTEGRLAYVGTHNWGKYPYNRGAYAEFQPGQAALFEQAIQPAGNILFAGEHTARESRGIEGAAESAVQAFSLL